MEKFQLRFHRFFSSVIMPVNAFAGIYSFMTAVRMASDDGFSTFSVIALLESTVVLALIFCTFRGLIRFKRSSLITLLALMTVRAADNIWALILSFENSSYPYTVSSLLGVIFSVLVSVYYLKRRKLFSREGARVVKISKEDYEKFQSEMEKMAWEKMSGKTEKEIGEESIPEYDCPRCKKHITDGSVFCPRCGYQTRKVNH